MASAVKDALKAYAGLNHVVIGNEELMERLQMIGIIEQSNGSKRVLTYKYPGAQRPKAIKLNSELGEMVG